MFLVLVILLLIPLRVMANAVVAESLIMAGGVLLIGTILAASGVKFLSQTDLLGASRTLLDKIRETDPSTWTGLSRIIAPLCAAGVKGSDYVLRLSDDLWNKVIGAYKGDIIQDDCIITGTPISVLDLPILSYCDLHKVRETITDGSFSYDSSSHILSVVRSSGHDLYTAHLSCKMTFDKLTTFYCNIPAITDKKSIFLDQVSISGPTLPLEQDFYPARPDHCTLPAGTYTITYFINGIYNCSNNKLYRYQVPICLSYGDVIDIEGIANLPNNLVNSIRLPDMPTMADDGTIVYPDLPLNPEANLGQVADLPGYSDVATVPLDLPINAETGKVITDIPDVPDVPDVPDIPAVSLGDILAAVNAATSAVGSIADALSQVPTMPSPGDLSLPALVVSKFPFCLPFDAYRLITLLDADPVAPSFEIPFKVGPIDEVMTFDFSYFDKAIQVFRWFEQITFVGALLYATRNFIKW